MSSTVRPCSARKPVTLSPSRRSHHLGQLRRQHDAEAVGAEPPAEGAAAVGVDLAPGRDHPRQRGPADRPWPPPSLGARPHPSPPARPRPGRHQRHRAVAEQGARHQVGGGDRGARQAQRAELDREQRGGVPGPAEQVVVQPRQPGRPGHAAEAEHRQPLQVRPQSQPGHQQGVKRRHRHPGHRRDDQQVQVAGVEPGRRQGAAQRPFPERRRLLDVPVVGGRAERAVVRQRQDRVPGVDPRVAVQPLEQRPLFAAVRLSRPPSASASIPASDATARVRSACG